MEQHSAFTSDHGPGQGRSNGRPRPAASQPSPAAAAGFAARSGPSSSSPGGSASSHAPSLASDSAKRGGWGADEGEATVYRAGSARPHLPTALSWLPRSRLTALGSGLLAILLMLLVSVVDSLLLRDSPVVYGTLFVLVSAVCVAWVRPADLFIAPVVAPIAFAVGLFPISGSTGNEGAAGHLMGMFPTLAVNAFWLYGGTLAGVLVAGVRKIMLIAQRSASGEDTVDGEDEVAEDSP